MSPSHVMSLLGSPHAVSRRTSLDLSRSDGADDLFDFSSKFPPAHNKRSMSWLLAAVMSVCEEDPRKCRVSGRGRQRVRGGDGEYVLVNTDDGALSTPLLDNDEALKRSVDDSRLGLEAVPVFNDQLSDEKLLVRKL